MYHARVDSATETHWLAYGKTYPTQAQGTAYASPLAAEKALRSFAEKAKGEHYFYIVGGDTIFAEVNPTTKLKTVTVKITARCDGTYKATAAGLSAISHRPGVACNRVINAWLKQA